MEIRDALPEDLQALVLIHDELLAATTFTWTEEPQTIEERRAVLGAKVARGFPTLVAVEGGDVIGVASYGDFRDSLRWSGYRFTVEHSVNVLERAWGRGVGKDLMRALLETALAAGVHVMVGGIDASNERSLTFHRRLGFVEVARMPEIGFKHGRWCDLVLVQRRVR